MNKISVLLAITASQAFAGEKKCRALVLSGGSNNGAWESGVIWGLLHYGEPVDFAWDVNTGVSAGSLNTGFTALFETGDELIMSERLSDMWASITANTEIYQAWGGGFPTILKSLDAMVTKESLWDDSPGF